MTSYFVDRFTALKYPEKFEQINEHIQNSLESRGINSLENAEKAEQELKQRKLSALKQASNEAGESLGLTPEDLLQMRSARSGKIRNSGRKRSARAMDVAAASFVESEKAGLSGEQAVTDALEAIGRAFGEGTREERTERNTVNAWLRDIQEWGVTTIPPALKGRPKKK